VTELHLRTNGIAVVEAGIVTASDDLFPEETR
jgi:hypothetical protein